MALSFLLSLFFLKRYILYPEFFRGPRVCAWLCTTGFLGQNSLFFCSLFLSLIEYLVHSFAVCSGEVCVPVGRCFFKAEFENLKFYVRGRLSRGGCERSSEGREEQQTFGKREGTFA